MSTAGQSIFELRKNFINKKDPVLRDVRVKKPSVSTASAPEPKVEEEVGTKEVVSPDTSGNPQEEPFKYIHEKLKLNQSAMSPDKTNVATQKLEDLAAKSDSVLLKVSTVWPFTFFVNHIIIDPYKVNIIFREFFWSEHIHSVMVKDILDVVVDTSIFFATLTIVDQGYIENSINITYLKRDDALKARKIIQGLVIAHRQSIDLSALKPSHIKEQAEELGKVKGIDKETAKYISDN